MREMGHQSPNFETPKPLQFCTWLPLLCHFLGRICLCISEISFTQRNIPNSVTKVQCRVSRELGKPEPTNYKEKRCFGHPHLQDHGIHVFT